MFARWPRLSNTATLPSQGKLSVLLPPGPACVTACCTLYCVIVHLDLTVGLLTVKFYLVDYNVNMFTTRAGMIQVFRYH
jgi:hypothetical protein